MTDCIFICSAGHSGSTLLDLLIGSHSSIASLGEISHLPKNLALDTKCTCGVGVRSCTVWQKVIDDMNGRLGTDIMAQPYDLNLGLFKAMVIVDHAKQTRLSLIWQMFIKAFWYLELRYGVSLFHRLTSHVKQGIDNNLLLYDAVGQVLDVELVVDSSKSYFKATELYRRHPKKVKIILLVRDGRAVFFSGIKNGYRRKRCVSVWNRVYARALPILEKNVDSSNILRVHYEDIARNPEKELRRICHFINVDFEPGMLDFANHEHHMTNGNNMRFSKDSSIRLDESWKSELAAADLKYFIDRAGALNRSFGYE